jgi:hypothetical protein
MIDVQSILKKNYLHVYVFERIVEMTKFGGHHEGSRFQREPVNMCERAPSHCSFRELGKVRHEG